MSCVRDVVWQCPQDEVEALNSVTKNLARAVAAAAATPNDLLLSFTVKPAVSPVLLGVSTGNSRPPIS
jgi:hypothetical protein